MRQRQTDDKNRQKKSLDTFNIYNLAEQYFNQTITSFYFSYVFSFTLTCHLSTTTYIIYKGFLKCFSAQFEAAFFLQKKTNIVKSYSSHGLAVVTKTAIIQGDEHNAGVTEGT